MITSASILIRHNSLCVHNMWISLETQLHFLQIQRAAWSVRNSFLMLSLTFAFNCLLGAPAPLQQSIHPLLQSSSLWWVSCHCLSLQLWTQLPEPDGPISTSSSLNHDAYEGASEPEASEAWPWSVEITLRRNNMAKRRTKKNVYSATLNSARRWARMLCPSFLECQYVF